jgi:hypothetical protein
MSRLSGVVRYAYIDSIEIRTDSVIVLPSLGLQYCHLTHLPPQIGEKIRVQSFDIGYNYKTLTSLPDELMQLSQPPEYWDTLIVKYDAGAVNAMSPDSVSDSLKSWLKKHSVSYY